MGVLSDNLRAKLNAVDRRSGPKAQRAASEAERALGELEERDARRAKRDEAEKQDLKRKYPALGG
jgi:hypothetical protein